MTITITVPMPPNLSNVAARASRSGKAQHFAKLRYWKQLDERQQCGLIPAPPSTPLESVTLTSVMYLGNAMDDDNAVARHKWVLDWLRTRGYVRDDRRRNLRWGAFPEQVVRRGHEYGIEITLSEAA